MNYGFDTDLRTNDLSKRTADHYEHLHYRLGIYYLVRTSFVDIFALDTDV